MSSGIITPYSPADFRPLTFFDAVPRFVAGDTTPRDYLETCLATIDALEPEVHAFATLQPDTARRLADESAARYRAGAPLSPIDGMPVGIKDLVETYDMPTQMGSDLFAGNHPNRDSALVQALRRSGAILVGKTTTTELGMSTNHGPTRHPMNTKRTPGGSSSGSGAVISARMLPVAIGSQVVGSAVRPASFNANWALKPTQGALHRGESQGYSQSTQSVHAGCLEDMWSVAVQIAKVVGGDPGHPGLYFTGQRAPAAQIPRRLAVLETEGWAEIHPGALQAFETVCDRLRGLGVTIIRRGDLGLLEMLEQRIADAMKLSREICAYESAWTVSNHLRKDATKLSDSLKARYKVGTSIDLQGYRERLLLREEMRRAFNAMGSEVDAFIGLGSCGPAPFIGDTGGSILGISHTTGSPSMNTAGSMLGCPVVNVPIMAVEQMPLGLAVSGLLHHDERTAAIGRWIAEAIPSVDI